jgi:hypothetical protein
MRKLIGMLCVVSSITLAFAMKSNWETTIDLAEKAAKQGDFAKSYKLIRNLESGLASKKMANLFKKYPKLAEAAKAEIFQSIALMRDDTSYKAAMEDVSFSQLLSWLRLIPESTTDDLQTKLRVFVNSKIADGSLALDFGSDLRCISTSGRFPNPDVGKMVLRNTIQRYSSGQFMDWAARNAVLAYLRFTPEARAEGLTLIQAQPWSASELKGIVAEIYPEFASQRLKEFTVKVKVSTPNLLLTEDLKAALGQFKTIEIAENSNFQLSVKALDSSFSQGIEQRDRITYDLGQVNLAVAPFLMPKNSVYQFEYTHGSDDFAYAYEVALSQSGAEVKRKLVGGRKTFQWSSCGSPMIINAFGGVNQISVIANGMMERMCARPSPRMIKQDAEKVALSDVAVKIVKMIRAYRSSHPIKRQTVPIIGPIATPGIASAP